MYFVQHYKYVHGGIPPGYENKEKFMCDQCPSVFFNNLSLKLHYKTKHSEFIKEDTTKAGRRNCPHCEKTFATYLSYKEHIKSKHEKDTPYKCDQVIFSFLNFNILHLEAGHPVNRAWRTKIQRALASRTYRSKL